MGALNDLTMDITRTSFTTTVRLRNVKVRPSDRRSLETVIKFPEYDDDNVDEMKHVSSEYWNRPAVIGAILGITGVRTDDWQFNALCNTVDFSDTVIPSRTPGAEVYQTVKNIGCGEFEVVSETLGSITRRRSFLANVVVKGTYTTFGRLEYSAEHPPRLNSVEVSSAKVVPGTLKMDAFSPSDVFPMPRCTPDAISCSKCVSRSGWLLRAYAVDDVPYPCGCVANSSYPSGI